MNLLQSVALDRGERMLFSKRHVPCSRQVNVVIYCSEGLTLGADAFVALYGLRYTLTDAELEAVEQKTDERLIAARRAKLQAYSGRLTDGEPHFLFVGTRLRVFGVENESQRSVDATQLELIMRDTATKLRSADIPGAPQLHLQLEAQY